MQTGDSGEDQFSPKETLKNLSSGAIFGHEETFANGDILNDRPLSLLFVGL
jgi:hypothetical protein